MIETDIHIFDCLNNRLDVSFYRSRFNFTSKSFPSFQLSELLWVNPTVKYENLSDNDVIAFVPMEVVDEQNGTISEQRTTTIAKTKGCGSTEFYVLRPKTDNVLIEYIHFILRDKRVLESAKNSFGGSAGQQRVSSSYLKSIQIPLPPIEIQQQIVALYRHAVAEKQAKEQEANALLSGIDDYLLKELGIELPENVGNERYFEVGIVMDDERLKNPDGRPDYYDELLERIRDIRVSEKRFYQKVRELFALSSDYDATDKATQMFFAETQNKLLYAA